MERQTIYGWPVVIDLFLAGSGAGAFLTGFIMSLFRVQESVSGIILLVSPLLVLIGSLFLLADITIRSRIRRLFSNSKSWTSRGAWILTIFIVSGAVYASAASPSSLRLPLLNNQLIMAAGIIAALFSLFVILYPGFLMSTIRALPFWNTPILPILFLLSGLSNGLVFIILMTPLFQNPPSFYMVEILHMLVGTAIVLMLLQAAALFAFLTRASRSNIAARESLRLLTLSSFRWKMFALGFTIPLGLFIFAVFTSKILLLSIVSMVAALFSLAGGLYLRYAVIRAGVFLPRFTI